MSIFNYIRRKLAASDTGPDVKFGRHAINTKEQVEQALLGQAIFLFEENKRLESIEYVLNYLRNDLEDNLAYDVENNEIFFELYQGSKKIIGRCNENKFVAISEIATLNNTNIGLFRKLLERNYLLKYCKFCLDGEKLILKFDSFTMDASPQKIFYALKEMAINADKYDDILADEFDELDNILSGKISYLSDEILTTKENFLRQSIQDTIHKVDNFSEMVDDKEAAISFLLLHCNYKLDYLIKPEGYVMEILERNHRVYFEQSKMGAAGKNEEIKKNLALILDRSSEQLREELYQTVHTFEYTKAASHLDLRNLINSELPKASAYYSKNQRDLALAVMSYIASYSLFHFSLPTPDIDMLSLLMRVLEDDYFLALGFNPNYAQNNTPIRTAVEKRIDSIIAEHKQQHPYFKPAYDSLVYTDSVNFAHSFLSMVAAYDIHFQKQLM